MVNQPEQNLKRRFREFLGYHGDPAADAVRQCIRHVLDRVVERKWQAYIVGGTLRDIMLAPVSAFPRDIDLVIRGVTNTDLYEAFEDLVERRTRFGGLHLVSQFGYGGISRSSGEVIFDVWRLEDTWGIRNAGLPPSIENFVKTPFLNIDSAAIELVPKSSRRRFAENGFFECLSATRLEINYAPNPYPFVCIARSLIMAAKLRFSIGRYLAEYISAHADENSVRQLIDAQISHYGRVRCHSQELRRWLREIRASVQNGFDHVDIFATEERQLELWQDWPPRSQFRSGLTAASSADGVEPLDRDFHESLPKR